MTNRPDKVEQFARIKEIYKLITQGANSIDVIQYATSKWGMGERNAYKLLAHARKWMANKITHEMGDMLVESNVRYDDLFAKLYRDKRWSEASRVQALKDRINGLDVETHKISGDLGINAGFQSAIEDIKEHIDRKRTQY